MKLFKGLRLKSSFDKTEARNVHVLPLWLRRLFILLMAGPGKGAKTIPFDLAILKLDRIGDFVLAVSAIRILLDRFGEQKSLLILSPQVSALARSQFPNVSIVEIPAFGSSLIRGMVQTWWKYSGYFRKLKIRNLVCLRHQRTPYHNLVLSWISSEKTFGATDPGWCINEKEGNLIPFLPSTASHYPNIEDGQNTPLALEIEAHRKITSSILNTPIEDHEILPKIYCDKRLSEFKDAVIVSPFGSTNIRSYAGEPIIKLLKFLQNQGIKRLVLAGDVTQRERLLFIQAEAAAFGCTGVEILPPCSLLEFVAVIASAKGIISVDTATAHIALALDKPMTGIIGGGHYPYYAPWGRGTHQKWLNHRVACYNCNWDCIHPEPLCITGISPQNIADTFVKILRMRVPDDFKN